MFTYDNGVGLGGHLTGKLRTTSMHLALHMYCVGVAVISHSMLSRMGYGI